jgi:hypothetical protein
MVPNLRTALDPVLDRIEALVVNDAHFRAQLRELGRVLLSLAEEPNLDESEPLVEAQVLPFAPPSPTTPVRDGVTASPPSAASLLDGRAIPPVNRPTPFPPNVPLSVLFPKSQDLSTALGQDPPSGPMHPPGPQVWGQRQIPDEELPIIEERCRLKAEGARWAATRRRRLKDGADFYAEIEPKDREIIGRAKALPDCFLWMCHRDGPMPPDLVLYDNLAGCFEAGSAAVAALRSVVEGDEGQEAFEHALDLVAEAQSAIRGAVAGMEGRPDGDQLKMFFWLRGTAASRQILIRRFMRGDDQADPAKWADLQERIKKFEATLQRSRDKDRLHKKLLGKIRYHSERIRNHPDTDRAADWQKIVEVVEELVADGVPPSNREIRDLLLVVLDCLPDSLETTKSFDLVLREVDRFLALRPISEDRVDEEKHSEEVLRAANLLRGRAVVLIGGDRRPRAEESLKSALGVSDLVWVGGRESTYVAFEPHVARPDVAVVLLAIRWSSHGFGEVKEYCEKYAKPLVRLPGGYNANQVAHNIVTQVGERLAAEGCMVPG